MLNGLFCVCGLCSCVCMCLECVFLNVCVLFVTDGGMLYGLLLSLPLRVSMCWCVLLWIKI